MLFRRVPCVAAITDSVGGKLDEMCRCPSVTPSSVDETYIRAHSRSPRLTQADSMS